jgi:hypothetical protein
MMEEPAEELNLAREFGGPNPRGVWFLPVAGMEQIIHA